MDKQGLVYWNSSKESKNTIAFNLEGKVSPQMLTVLLAAQACPFLIVLQARKRRIKIQKGITSLKSGGAGHTKNQFFHWNNLKLAMNDRIHCFRTLESNPKLAATYRGLRNAEKGSKNSVIEHWSTFAYPLTIPHSPVAEVTVAHIPGVAFWCQEIMTLFFTIL